CIGGSLGIGVAEKRIGTSVEGELVLRIPVNLGPPSGGIARDVSGIWPLWLEPKEVHAIEEVVRHERTGTDRHLDLVVGAGIRQRAHELRTAAEVRCTAEPIALEVVGRTERSLDERRGRVGVPLERFRILQEEVVWDVR